MPFRFGLGCNCCGGCDDLPLTLYIRFDHNFDGVYEDGPYEMTYDPALDAWTYTLIVTWIGSEPSNVYTDDCENPATTATHGVHYAIKKGLLAARRLTHVSYWVCWTGIGLAVLDGEMTPGWTASATGAHLGVSPEPHPTGSGDWTPGYTTPVLGTVIDSCIDQVAIINGGLVLPFWPTARVARNP